MKHSIMKLLYRLAHRGQLIYWAVWRPITLGVNVLIVQNGEVLLVRPTYKNSWSLPGGGLKRNETLAQAAQREVCEEVGFTLHDLRFVTIHSNLMSAKSDHVALYISESFTPPAGRHHSYEIDDYRFFPINALPASISSGTRHTIETYL